MSHRISQGFTRYVFLVKKNIQERDDSGVSLATLNCETFILYKKIIQE